MASRENSWPLALTVSGAIVVIVTLILDRDLTYDFGVEGGDDVLSPAGQTFIIGLAILTIGLTMLLDRTVRALRTIIREPGRQPERAKPEEAER
jgi:hypothetical protein